MSSKFHTWKVNIGEGVLCTLKLKKKKKEKAFVDLVPKMNDFLSNFGNNDYLKKTDKL